MNGDDFPNINHDSSDTVRENSEVVIIYPYILYIYVYIQTTKQHFVEFKVENLQEQPINHLW